MLDDSAKPWITFNDVFLILTFYSICAWQLCYGWGKIVVTVHNL